MVGMWWNNQFCSENQHLSSLPQIKERIWKSLTQIPVCSVEFYLSLDCHKMDLRSLLRLAAFQCKSDISLFDILQHQPRLSDGQWWDLSIIILNYLQVGTKPGQWRVWYQTFITWPGCQPCHTTHCFPLWPPA